MNPLSFMGTFKDNGDMYSKIKGVKDIDKTMLLNTGKQQKDLVRKDFTSVCCRMHLAENAMNPKGNSTYRANRD